MFQQELPDLYQHMHAQGFSIPMYGIEWFTTLVRVSLDIDAYILKPFRSLDLLAGVVLAIY